MNKTPTASSALPLLALMMVSALAAAQPPGAPADLTQPLPEQGAAPVPGPRINRNPVFRQSLPPAPPLPLDPRDTVLPVPESSDPRATVIEPPPVPDPRATTAPGVRLPASSPRATPQPR
ncbi:MAG: hypothetical protein Q7S97_05810 [Polaromonas sp.]|nr:hypothetical protein [Polaromonas sp.]